MACPIGWQPNALAPVFYGFREHGPSDGAPVPLTIHFPSIDVTTLMHWNPREFEILKGCGRYPLIVLAHAHCANDPANYKAWAHLPVRLARAGYVVIVPHLAATTSGIHPTINDADLQTLADVLTWARTGWEHHETILPAPSTGIIGHSEGAVLAARFATANAIAAYVSLGGKHGDLEQRPYLIERLAVPRLVIYGGNEGEAFRLSDVVFNALASPKHRAVFSQGEHWDYVDAGALVPCSSSRGPCEFLMAATTDLVTMFFAKYLPPELTPNLPDSVPDTLVPPALNLTPEQESYAPWNYLRDFANLNGPACEVKLYSPLERVVPFVISSPQAVARNDVLEVDLVPKFSGGEGSGPSYVISQSPSGGTIVNKGTTVKMLLTNGPIP